MMKPKFDDVLDYVRDGEVDPEMEELLDLDPDGQELLKQARFICKVLQDRYGESGDIGIAADADMAWGDIQEDAVMIAESSEPEDRQIRSLQKSASLREPRRMRSAALNRMLAGIYSERQDLGTLSFAADEERISATYEPSEFVAAYAEKFLRKIPQTQLGLLGVQIQSQRINIALPESIAVGDPITLHLSSSLRQMPARYLGLVFMPDAGPFVRLQSDDKGSVDLPGPMQSGILRIETDEAHFLQIKVEES